MLYLASLLLGGMAGFLPLLPIMALFHFALRKKDKKSNMKTAMPHIVAVYIFCLALTVIFSITDIPSVYVLELDAVMNFVPFAALSGNFHQYVLNILLFVPVGFLLPALWKKFGKWHLTFACGFLLSLSIEIIQLFNSRITDIDDLLMNTAGAIIGYCLFLLAKRMFPKIAKLSIDGKNHWKWEPYACFCFAWGSMLLVQPFVYSLLSRIFFQPFIQGPPRFR